MPDESALSRGETAAMVGDAAIFSAATVFIAPLNLVIGPAAAWYLHGRRMDGAAVLSGLLGLLGGMLSVVALYFGLVALTGGFAQRGDSEDFTGGLILLGVACAVLLAVLVALDIGALRDLRASRRKHVRLDIVRLIVTLVLVVGTAAVVVVQTMNPASEAGDAGVFALMAGAVSAVTTYVGVKLYAAWRDRGSAAGPAAT
jgi:hypothetical protein